MADEISSQDQATNPEMDEISGRQGPRVDSAKRRMPRRPIEESEPEESSAEKLNQQTARCRG